VSLETLSPVAGLVVPWTPVPLASGWSAFGAGYAAPSYCKDSVGFVHLQGLATWAASGATGNPILTMPVGFRYSVGTLLFMQMISGGTLPIRLDLLSSGALNSTAMPAGPGTWVSLAGMSWWADS
jgi:hypothetical protein